MTAAPVLTRSLKFKVTVSNGESSGKNFEFEKAVVTIGRGPENDLVFSSDPKMSRLHAEIRTHLGQVSIRNVSQKNYIYVNGERVEEKTLKPGTSVQIGDTILKIQFEEVAELNEVTHPVQDVHTSPYPLFPVDDPAPQALAPIAPPVSGGKLRPGAAPQASQFPAPTAAPILQMQAAPQMPAPTPLAQPLGQQRSQPKKAPPKRRPVAAPNSGGNRLRFYMIILVVGGLLFWFFSNDNAARRPEQQLRTEGDVARSIEESAQAVQEIRKLQETKGQDTLQYRAAQEHYIRGFRDYRVGQYARAMQSFQAALSFYPGHELARKYYLQSQRKFEAQIDSHMAQGRKYHQKQNFRMCQSSFASVMIMLKDPAKVKYKEAKQLYDECSLRLEGRY